MNMKKMMMIFICFVVWGVAGSLAAQDLYVSGVTKITMRTGPGVEHKIVAMLTSGEKLETIEYQSDWSLVKTQNGKTGWVLTRFLTEEAPPTLRLGELQKENETLVAELQQAQEKIQTLMEKNLSLGDIQEKYKELEQASSDYLQLNAKYKALVKEFQDQKDHIESLEMNMNNEEKLWFLSGAGVFVVGLIIGLITRKKKRTSLL